MYGPWPNDQWRPIIANRWPIPQGQVEAALKRMSRTLNTWMRREYAEAERNRKLNGRLNARFADVHQAIHNAHSGAHAVLEATAHDLGLVLHESKSTEVKQDGRTGSTGAG